MDKAIRGMVAALDPHCAYLDSEEFEEIRLSTMGSTRALAQRRGPLASLGALRGTGY